MSKGPEKSEADIEPHLEGRLPGDMQNERLELYRVMVETITANENRRQQMMTVYITVVIAVFAAFGTIPNLDPLHLAILAIPFSVVWFWSLVYFRSLAKAKFKVIDQLEDGFFVRPFGLEWQYLSSAKPKLSTVEMAVPLSILVASMGFLVWRLVLHA